MHTEKRAPLVIIAGPTAVGKSAVSVALARQIGGEVISADSVQVYRGLDIGSAKVTEAEMQGIPHHLIDVLDPAEGFDVQRFQEMAMAAVRKVLANGHIPILCGGTGFYIQALLYGIDFREEDDGQSEEIRKRLEAEAERPGGKEALYARLARLDPASCEKIHRNNLRRVIRALCFYELHGSPISAHNEAEHRRPMIFDALFYVLTDDREALYDRIDRRVSRMAEDGLLEEAAGLYRMLREGRIPADATSLSGIGYRELLPYFASGGDPAREIPEALLGEIRKDSRNYAKRQLTWFRREKEARWIDIRDFGRDPEKTAESIAAECRRHYPALLQAAADT